MKRFLSFILTVVLLLSLMPTGLFGITAKATTTENAQEFMGGTGTETDPYLISNRTHLNNVRKYLNAHFKLICDIAFDDDDFAIGGNFYNSGAGFVPIGDKSSAFKGTFDGNGHIITNIHITASSSESAVYAGLFGYNDGTIKNLGVVDSNISITTSYNSAYVGAIAGYNDGTILNCFNTSTVSASYRYLSSSSINSYYVGGIVGRNYSGTITNCYNTGTVSSRASHLAYSGGIAGENRRTIANCYNTGTVFAKLWSSDYSAYSGGIAGANSSNIKNCYNIGTTWATSDLSADVGGIIGLNSGTTKNCFYADIASKGVGSGVDKATKCTASELTQQSTFKGFDFENIWMFDEGLVFHLTPVLKEVKHIEDSLSENTTEFAGGYGTYYAPYLISTQAHLNNARNYLGSHFKLLCDIDFNGVSFAPIGTSSPFTGTFDGNGYAIKNLKMATYGDRIGIFGVNNGVIRNLEVINSSVLGTSQYNIYAGGIVGYNGGVIENCYYEGGVSAYTSADTSSYESYVGGVAGYSSGLITNCRNIGTISTNVSAEAFAGGVVGYNDNGIITYSYNTGGISAKTSYPQACVGGISGYNKGGVISNCYNTGSNVSAESSLFPRSGGIAGLNNNGTITNCYNVGAVSAVDTGSSSDFQAYIGGIAGASNGTITYCYYLDTILKGVGTIDAGNKCTADELRQQSIFVGFDFEKVWTFDDTLESYSFPVLKNIGHFEQENKNEFAGGYGTSYRPYLIANKTHLSNVRYYLGAHFKLMCDIDFEGANFTPIGESSTSAFTGTFDGNGYAIKNINIVNSSYCNEVAAGIFGYNKGMIKNLGIVGGCISAESLYSYSYYEANAGGIVGTNTGVITNCYNLGTRVEAISETSSSYAGGIVGLNWGTVMNCYNTGYISTTAHFDAYTGGIAGLNGGTITSGTITNCYNTGNLYGSDVGGIVGYNNVTVTNCYYLNTASTGLGYGIGSTTKCTESSLKKQSTYAGFDFGFVWEIDSSTGYEYPQLVSRIKALSVFSQPANNIYVEGLNPDLAGASLKIEYDLANEPKEKFIPITLDMLDGFNNQVVGAQEVYVRYNNLVSANTLGLSGLARAITSIKVTTTPTKLTYVYGQPTNFNGTKITVYYNDNTTETVGDGLHFTYNSEVGTVPVTVSYKGFADTFDIIVKDRVVQTVTFTEPTKTSYLEGEDLDLSGGYFKVVFVSDDNYTETISLDKSMISGYDKDTPGYQTVTATYAEKSKTFVVNIIAADYVIIFKDWDGSVLSSGTYHKGDLVTPPAEPSRMPDNTYTYVFSGWNQEVVSCTGNTTYTATYTPVYIDYTVEFKNWDGSVISTKTYHYGDKVTTPANPTRATDNICTYIFAGWDNDVVNCSGDVTYTAVYTSKYIDYLVSFWNWEGSLISCHEYHWGDQVTSPVSTPFRESDNTYFYEFTGWDKKIIDCAGNANYTATYKPIYRDYTVTFQYEDGTLIEQYTLHYGDSVAAPATPAVPDVLEGKYEFSGWNKEITDCQGNAVYTAVFVRTYIIGDLTGDGKINSLDGLLLMRYLNGWNVNIASPEAMDVNGDGKVNSLDGLILMRYLNGWNVTLG